LKGWFDPNFFISNESCFPLKGWANGWSNPSKNELPEKVLSLKKPEFGSKWKGKSLGDKDLVRVVSLDQLYEYKESNLIKLPCSSYSRLTRTSSFGEFDFFAGCCAKEIKIKHRNMIENKMHRFITTCFKFNSKLNSN
jgi:hypothetical protein